MILKARDKPHKILDISSIIGLNGVFEIRCEVKYAFLELGIPYGAVIYQ